MSRVSEPKYALAMWPSEGEGRVWGAQSPARTSNSLIARGRRSACSVGVGKQRGLAEDLVRLPAELPWRSDVREDGCGRYGVADPCTWVG